jgi:citrate synthase
LIKFNISARMAVVPGWCPVVVPEQWYPNGGDSAVARTMTTAEAARRLGVKPATLYAYVSRGVLTRDKTPDGRASLFDLDEVERLARRGRPRRPAGVADIVVESAITRLTAGSLHFRGRDATRLAVTHSFEEVAELLWTGQTGAHQWRVSPAALAAGRGAQAALPEGILPLERFQVTVPAMAVTDPLRLQLDQSAVLAAARSIVAGMIGCLPWPGAASETAAGSYQGPDPADPGVPVAERLWSRLCGQRPTPGLLRVLSAALVLLADHELAASTLAVRAAASVRADPYSVVGTGLGAMSGTLHGGASLGTEALIAAARGPADVPRVVAELLRRGEKVPGLGHSVYRGGDPRAVVLLDLIRQAAPKSGQLAVAEALLAEVRAKSLPEPNVDFALATMARVAGMVRGAAEAVFAVSRTAGWIAHALEAYAADGILRPRAVYTGRHAGS